MGNLCNTIEKNEQITELEIGSSKIKILEEIVYYPMQSTPLPESHLKKIKTLMNLGEKIKTILYTDGSEYSGQVSNDFPNGFGEFRHKNGDLYKGNFLNGYANGIGTYTTNSNGTVYKGNFIKDTKNGSGEEKYSNGDIFKGSFKKNNKTRGSYQYSDGDNFNGLISDNKRNGLGVMKFTSGETYYGDWVNDCKEGKGKLVYADKTIYEGEFLKNMEVFDVPTNSNQNI